MLITLPLCLRASKTQSAAFQDEVFLLSSCHDDLFVPLWQCFYTTCSFPNDVVKGNF